MLPSAANIGESILKFVPSYAKPASDVIVSPSDQYATLFATPEPSTKGKSAMVLSAPVPSIS